VDTHFVNIVIDGRKLYIPLSTQPPATG
jgi:hypothetical protein